MSDKLNPTIEGIVEEASSQLQCKVNRKSTGQFEALMLATVYQEFLSYSGHRFFVVIGGEPERSMALVNRVIFDEYLGVTEAIVSSKPHKSSVGSRIRKRSQAQVMRHRRAHLSWNHSSSASLQILSRC
jgi:hypothetical protein